MATPPSPPLHNFSPSPQAWNWKRGKYSPTPYASGLCCNRPQDFRSHLFNEHVLRVYSGYLVASDIEPRPSGLESDTLTTRLPMTQKRLPVTNKCT
ncbi:hypothetical protein TNCV_1578291 [Trichonephila clavipes]|nr:hypothetical protein TNCV_1578291 [Trichonephila clavipes]